MNRTAAALAVTGESEDSHSDNGCLNPNPQIHLQCVVHVVVQKVWEEAESLGHFFFPFALLTTSRSIPHIASNCILVVKLF